MHLLILIHQFNQIPYEENNENIPEESVYSQVYKIPIESTPYENIYSQTIKTEQPLPHEILSNKIKFQQKDFFKFIYG
jgi:hypothetical protein